MSGFALRPMTREDAKAVARLEEICFTDPWPEEVFLGETALGPLSRSYVIEDRERERIAAYMVTTIVADEAHLNNVAVAPDYRRQGLAQVLLDRVEEEARESGCRLIALEVRRSNTSAKLLYRKNGYYTVMIRRGYYADNGEDALVMIRPLSEAGRIPPARKFED